MFNTYPACFGLRWHVYTKNITHHRANIDVYRLFLRLNRYSSCDERVSGLSAKLSGLRFSSFSSLTPLEDSFKVKFPSNYLAKESLHKSLMERFIQSG